MILGHELVHARTHGIRHPREPEPRQSAGTGGHPGLIELAVGDAEHPQGVAGHALVLRQDLPPNAVRQPHPLAIVNVVVADGEQLLGAAFDGQKVLVVRGRVQGAHVGATFGPVAGAQGGALLAQGNHVDAPRSSPAPPAHSPWRTPRASGPRWIPRWRSRCTATRSASGAAALRGCGDRGSFRRP